MHSPISGAAILGRADKVAGGIYNQRTTRLIYGCRREIENFLSLDKPSRFTVDGRTRTLGFFDHFTRDVFRYFAARTFANVGDNDFDRLCQLAFDQAAVIEFRSVRFGLVSVLILEQSTD